MLKRLLACIIVYGIDLLFVTPYAIAKCGLREAGLLNSFGLTNLGFIWLPIWFIVFGIGLYLLFNWIDGFKNQERKEMILSYVTITFVALMFGTIAHNLIIINNYC